MSNKSFINNIISEFPTFILEDRNSNLLINYIKEVSLKIANAKDEQFKDIIRHYSAEINYRVENFIDNHLNN